MRHRCTHSNNFVVTAFWAYQNKVYGTIYQWNTEYTSNMDVKRSNADAVESSSGIPMQNAPPAALHTAPQSAPPLAVRLGRIITHFYWKYVYWKIAKKDRVVLTSVRLKKIFCKTEPSALVEFRFRPWIKYKIFCYLQRVPKFNDKRAALEKNNKREIGTYLKLNKFIDTAILLTGLTQNARIHKMCTSQNKILHDF